MRPLIHHHGLFCQLLVFLGLVDCFFFLRKSPPSLFNEDSHLGWRVFSLSLQMGVHFAIESGIGVGDVLLHCQHFELVVQNMVLAQPVVVILQELLLLFLSQLIPLASFDFLILEYLISIEGFTRAGQLFKTLLHPLTSLLLVGLSDPVQQYLEAVSLVHPLAPKKRINL